MKIVLYSIEKCRECEIVKEKLDDSGVQYEVFDDWDEMQKLGIKLLPVLEVDGEKIYHEELGNYDFLQLKEIDN